MIDKGKIAEQGTHDELLQVDGVYKCLVLPQLTDCAVVGNLGLLQGSQGNPRITSNEQIKGKAGAEEDTKRDTKVDTHGNVNGIKDDDDLLANHSVNRIGDGDDALIS